MQYVQRMKSKWMLKMGMKNNATRQMHFRPQVLFWWARGWNHGPSAATSPVLPLSWPDNKSQDHIGSCVSFLDRVEGSSFHPVSTVSTGCRPCPAPERCCVVSGVCRGAWGWFRAVRVAWGTQEWLVCSEPGLMFRGTPCCVLEPRPALGALKPLGKLEWSVPCWNVLWLPRWGGSLGTLLKSKQSKKACQWLAVKVLSF